MLKPVSSQRSELGGSVFVPCNFRVAFVLSPSSSATVATDLLLLRTWLHCAPLHLRPEAFCVLHAVALAGLYPLQL